MIINKKISRGVCSLFLLAFLTFVPHAFADSDKDSQKIGIKDAVAMAIKNSRTLAKDMNNIDYKQKTLDDAGSLVKYTPVSQSVSPGDANVFSNYLRASLDYRSQERQKEYNEKQLIIDARKAYYEVVSLTSQVKTKEMALNTDKVKLDQARVKKEVGVATEADVIAAESQVISDIADLTDYNGQLDKAYVNLDQILGIDISNRPVLTDTIDYAAEKVSDVDHEVAKALANSYEVWSAKEALNVAKSVQVFERSWEKADINVANANLTVLDTKDQITKQVKSICVSINALDDKYNQLKQKEKEAQENLRITRAMFDVGMLTRDKVMAADLGLAQVRDSISGVIKNINEASGLLKKITGSDMV